MGKLIYSTYSKIIIGILFVVSLLGALTMGLDGIKKWDSYEKEIYLFEDHFEDSYFLNMEMNGVFYDIYNGAVQYVNDNSFDVTEILTEQIDKKEMDYILIVDGKQFASSAERNHTFFYNIKIDKEGAWSEQKNPRQGGFFVDPTEVKGHEVEIYIGLKDSFALECENLWNEQRTLVNGTIKNVTYWILAALACLIYLIVVTGRDEQGNKKSHGIDRLFTEFNVILMGGILTGCCLIICAIINTYSYSDFPYELLTLYTQITVGVTATVLLILLLSMVRNIKNGTFFSRCFLVIVFRGMIKMIKKMFHEMGKFFFNRFAAAAFGILFIYTAIIGLFGYISWCFGPLYIFLGILLFIILGFFVMKYFISLKEIKEGVEKIRQGELSYKMDKMPFKDLNDLKDGINDISSGLQASVNKMIKAERMKTELITNVSHDLKTPLTSIISYTKLLSDVEDLPEEARDYIAIIDKKSQRLKTLTQDLFDIAKVQSGNEEIVMEKLNLETLLSQALAEYENAMENLTLCTKIEEGLFIRSDGRKLSRVINNLLDNAIKYSLPNTRVYINAYGKDNKAFIEIKNISSYALDFDKEEIMQRFKRGDESRTEEGHGLGLAIAKSYVEVTGGRFDIALDGDLFKAIIEYEQQ